MEPNTGTDETTSSSTEVKMATPMETNEGSLTQLESLFDIVSELEGESSLEDGQNWESVPLRGRKRSPSPITLDKRVRSQSKESCPKVIAARALISKTHIHTGAGEWFSCQVGEDCMSRFSDFVDYLGHIAERHPGATPKRFPCPLHRCKAGCNNPREWSNHLASRHPDFVLDKSIEFFNHYYLSDN